MIGTGRLNLAIFSFYSQMKFNLNALQIDEPIILIKNDEISSWKNKRKWENAWRLQWR